MSTFLSTIDIPDWRILFEKVRKEGYWEGLMDLLTHDAQLHTLYPPSDQIFTALELCPAHQTKCIIVGQDPYHGPGQANGLSFSVPNKQKIPPSLRNILKEYQSDLGFQEPCGGSLEAWAKEGVLLLNAVLTVRGGAPGSHKNWGWEKFTRAAIRFALEQSPSAGFICFGKPALNLVEEAIEGLEVRPVVISTPHPSPLSAYRGFFGSKPFTTFNNKQLEKGREIVNWELPSSPQTSLF